MESIGVIRSERDEELFIYSTLILSNDKLYFIHSNEKINFPEDISIDEFLKLYPDSISLLAIEDLESINNHYYVKFDSLEQLISILKDLDTKVYNDLFFNYSMNQYGEYDEYKYYRLISIIYMQMYGSFFTNEIVSSDEVKGLGFDNRFFFSSSDEFDFFTFANIYENEIDTIQTYGFKKGFRGVIFNSDYSGAITDNFLMIELLPEEFSKRICLFFKDKYFGKIEEVDKKMRIAERKYKIDVLLNPHYHISEFKKSLSKS